MAEKQASISVTPAELATMIGSAVQAAVKGIRAEDDRRAAQSAKAEHDRIIAEAVEAKRRSDIEAGRPPRRHNVDRKEVDDLARKFRSGSSVKVRVHRRFRAKAHRKGDDTSEPPRMGAVHPDEVVMLPVHPEAMGGGQSPRELAHMSLTGMFDLA